MTGSGYGISSPFTVDEGKERREPEWANWEGVICRFSHLLTDCLNVWMSDVLDNRCSDDQRYTVWGCIAVISNGELELNCGLIAISLR